MKSSVEKGEKSVGKLSFNDALLFTFVLNTFTHLIIADEILTRRISLKPRRKCLRTNWVETENQSIRTKSRHVIACCQLISIPRWSLANRSAQRGSSDEACFSWQFWVQKRSLNRRGTTSNGFFRRYTDTKHVQLSLMESIYIEASWCRRFLREKTSNFSVRSREAVFRENAAKNGITAALAHMTVEIARYNANWVKNRHGNRLFYFSEFIFIYFPLAFAQRTRKNYLSAVHGKGVIIIKWTQLSIIVEGRSRALTVARACTAQNRKTQNINKLFKSINTCERAL